MAADDPLGDVTFRYDSTLLSVAMLAGGAVLLAAGAGVWFFAGQLGLAPELATTVTPLAGGIGAVLVVVGVLYGRMGIEVREAGVRYRSGGRVTEIPWQGLKKLVVEENKRHSTRGLHTDSTWRVKVVGEGDTIDLSGSFLKLVGDVPTLIRAMEEAGGVEARWDGRDEGMVGRHRGTGKQKKRPG